MNKNIKVVAFKYEKRFLEFMGKGFVFNGYFSKRSETLNKEIHHYFFTYGKQEYHISFTDISIILSKIIDMEKGIEKDIYAGYSPENLIACLKKEKKLNDKKN